MHGDVLKHRHVDFAVKKLLNQHRANFTQSACSTESFESNLIVSNNTVTWNSLVEDYLVDMRDRYVLTALYIWLFLMCYSYRF